MHFLGVLGAPYYIVVALLVLQLTNISEWFYLLLLPAWYAYDRLSQPAYVQKVKYGNFGNLKFAMWALGWQFLFCAAVASVLWFLNT